MKLDLDEILNKHASDKQSKHGYAPIYHALFKHLRNQPVTLLEIGIGTVTPGASSSMYGHDLPGYRPGASLRTWRDYFRNAAVVYGIDVQPDTMIFDDPRIVTALCDSTDAEAAKTYLGASSFDIIIDDGIHVPELQIKTLCNFYPSLKPNGIYVIEDVEPRGSWTSSPEFENIIGDALYFVVSARKADLVVISKRDC